MKVAKYIANLGYGTRREVERMLAEGSVTRRDGTPIGARDDVEHDDILVEEAPLDPPPGVVIMMHKPVGYVCSTSDVNAVVYDLMPRRFRERTPIIAPVGRLDLDTSGLLLLTDDGPLNHRITSPKSHLPKVYEAGLAQDLRGDEAEVFASGDLMLEGEENSLREAVLEVVDKRHVRLTVTEGKYHQVRRMFAAVGNHVVSLHRSQIGPLTLGALEPGKWRTLGPDDLHHLKEALRKNSGRSYSS